MLKLQYFKISIWIWRRAIAISETLKPKTWKGLAIGQGVLALLLLCDYVIPLSQDPSIPPLQAELSEPAVPKDYLPALGARDSLVTQANISELVPVASQYAYVSSCAWMIAANTSYESLKVASNGTVGLSLTSTNHMDADNRLSAVTVHETADGSISQVPGVLANTVPWFSAPEKISLLETLQKTLALVQIASMTLGSLLASLFSWIGYHRGKADLKLKELQIREVQARLDKMEREREREIDEARKSGIILIT